MAHSAAKNLQVAVIYRRSAFMPESVCAYAAAAKVKNKSFIQLKEEGTI
ncbi:MAG: hypothetical protein LUI60_07440 [Clostridia bacterium]|nr:hypothetical protein [Clostridia bacterium]